MDVGRQLTALADPTRRTIYELVTARHGSVRELTDLVPVSQPAVSQHLKVLREADLVAMTRHGTRHHYAAKRESLGPLRTWLDSLWDEALDAFADAAEQQARNAVLTEKETT